MCLTFKYRIVDAGDFGAGLLSIAIADRTVGLPPSFSLPCCYRATLMRSSPVEREREGSEIIPFRKMYDPVASRNQERAYINAPVELTTLLVALIFLQRCAFDNLIGIVSTVGTTNKRASLENERDKERASRQR